MADDKPQPLLDFTGADAAKEWQAVNDGVMGGVSEGKFKITDKKTLEFFGTLSLENNGGFASVRTKAKKLGLEKGDTLVARVRGDGREYSMNLHVPKPLAAFSYRATLQTKKDEWIEVTLPLDKFVATSFGRVVKDAARWTRRRSTAWASSWATRRPARSRWKWSRSRSCGRRSEQATIQDRLSKGRFPCRRHCW